MILYVDETENDDFFIVAGVLFPDEKVMELAYKQFKRRVENLELKPSVKTKVYTEFKGNYIEKKAKRVKNLIMQSLQESVQRIIYGIYKKPTKSFPQEEKEMVFIKLLSDIVDAMDEPAEIVFDAFMINNFDNSVVNIISQNANCILIQPKDSQTTHGLQYADNACGAIRLKYTGENEKYWDMVSEMIFCV